MPKEIYVRTLKGVGILKRTNSCSDFGKFVVLMKGDDKPGHYTQVSITSEEDYKAYKPEPAKQPAKRSKKS